MKALGPLLRQFFERQGHEPDVNAVKTKYWRVEFKQYVADLYVEACLNARERNALEFGIKAELIRKVQEDLNDWKAYTDVHGKLKDQAATSAIWKFINQYSRWPKPKSGEEIRQEILSKDIDGIIESINQYFRDGGHTVSGYFNDDYFDEEDMIEMDSFFNF